MIDFPNAPSAGQIFQAAGLTFIWDGVKWKAIAPLPSNNIGRNYLHNPYFNINQRGTGQFTATGVTADRWWLSMNGDTSNVSVVALTDGNRTTIGDEFAQNCFYINVNGTSAAGNYTQVYQATENVHRLSGKTVTVSFWAASGSALNVGVRIQQTFGAGGSPSPPINTPPQVVTVAVGSTNRYALTFNLPSSAGKTMGTTANTDNTAVIFGLSSGATNSAAIGVGVQTGAIWFWGVQCEIGNAPSPLEKIDPRIDFENCMRFYQVYFPIMLSGYSDGAGRIFYSGVPLTVPMRITPTTTFAGTNYSNASTLQNWATNPQALGYAVTATAAGYFYGYGTATLAADL